LVHIPTVSNTQAWKQGDTLVLEEQLQEGFWKVKLSSGKSVTVLLVETDNDDKHKTNLVTTLLPYTYTTDKVPY
jgi:hypothetical protein